MNRFIKIYGLLASLLLILLILQNQQLKQNAGLQVIADSSTYYSFPEDGSPIIGRPDAPISVVTFTDYGCQSCSDLTIALYELMAKYPDKINWTYKHHPVEKHSESLTRAALAAHKQGAFGSFHQNLFGLHADKETILAMAAQAGLDPDQFERDMDSQEISGELQKLQSEAIQLEIVSIPTLFINGVRISGGIPQDLEPLFLKIAPEIAN